MKLLDFLIRLLDSPSPPPAKGWANKLPEAFGALNENNDVYVIGYKGEWYFPVKPSLRGRIRNRLVARFNSNPKLDRYLAENR